MKFITKALLGLSLMAGFSGTAFAADAYAPEPAVTMSGWYLRGDMGWSWMNSGDDYNNGFLAGGGAGYKFNDNLRADLRGDYAGIGNDDTYFGSVLGNVYFDIPTQTMVTPYLGAGIGYGWADVNGNNHNGVAYGLMAGVEVSLTDNVSADVGYRFRQVIDGDSTYANEALVGLRYSF